MVVGVLRLRKLLLVVRFPVPDSPRMVKRMLFIRSGPLAKPRAIEFQVPVDELVRFAMFRGVRSPLLRKTLFVAGSGLLLKTMPEESYP